MHITPVDNELNLFSIENVFSEDLVSRLLATDWLNMPWQRQEGQESWARRRVNESALPWIEQWHAQVSARWDSIQQQLGMPLQHYCGTAFWIDEPGFVCKMHTDGELPGGMQIIWHGPGTSFYWHNNTGSLRYQTPSHPNTGYIMINRADSTGYRRLLWHAMLTPVENFRVTSYIWLQPK